VDLKRILVSVIKIAIAVLIGLPVILYFLQEKLLFYPQPLSDELRKAIVDGRGDLEELLVDGAHGLRLHGWLRKGEQDAPLLIYFGGNAEEITPFVSERGALPGWAIASLNYRGFGLSVGAPGEKPLFADAVSIYDHLLARPDLAGREVFVMGRSLGSGVAVYLATQRKVSALVLVTPYDSIANLAQQRYPTVPVRLVLKHRFDSLSRAPTSNTPALILVGSADTLVPMAHSEKLFEAWAGPKQWRAFAGADHIDISRTAAYWPTITAFLAKVPGGD
jgi:pimeloyl-ACP methyl ester carboxylesterase